VIAADTNVWIAFLNGKKNKTTDLLAHYLEQGLVLMPPIVLFELLSGNISQETQGYLVVVPQTPFTDTYWIKAAHVRKKLMSKGLKSQTADCLIAQSCIDADCLFITEDKDFRHYGSFGLRLS
jgi:predicted nucleic acid-binding protein